MLFFKRNARVKPAQAASPAPLQCRCFACCHHAAKASQAGSRLGWTRFYFGVKLLNIPPR